MNTGPTARDLDELRGYFDAAISACDEIGIKDGYPVYPKPISEFMRYIASSSWCDHNYKPAETRDILSRIDSASISEVKSALTAVSRSERFSTGAWKTALVEGRISLVVERAAKILKA